MTLSSRLALVGLLAFSFSPLAELSARGADDDAPSRSELRAAQADMARAVKDRELARFVEHAGFVLRADDDRVTRGVLEAYAELAESIAELRDHRGLHWLHGEIARAIAEREDEEVREELERYREKGKEWRARLLLVDIAALDPELDVGEWALAALEDDHPVVVRRALRYLVKDERVEVVEAIVGRWVGVEEKPPRKDRPEWVRTALRFRSTLRTMLHVDLPAAVDWKNWLEVYRDSPKLFAFDEALQDERTAVTLFGTAITGKNIVFVLDVSGSMMTTDPLPPGESGPPSQGRTVGEKERRRQAKERLESRRRIYRAKRELGRVIRSLPEDVRFNVVSYSSAVSTWEKGLEAASDDNKKRAVEYVEELEAEGITVTDEALVEAFAELDVDTIYLVTDGAPTHVGSRTRGLPPDSEVLMRQIREDIEVRNFLRDVRIFCLGFPGAHEEFLEDLAAENGGKYAPIR